MEKPLPVSQSFTTRPACSDPNHVPKKRAADDFGEHGTRKRKSSATLAIEPVDSEEAREQLSSTELPLGISGVKLKRPEKEQLKLPRFGEKLSAAPTDLGKLHARLSNIYESKLQAFQWPRCREIVLTEGSGSSTTKRCDASVGRLDATDMSVEVSRFRGTFSSYFGRHFMTQDGEAKTTLSPFEAFFLLDNGSLELVLNNAVLAVEDVRALMEAKVANFPSRYALFSEIHRATQLYAKPYGVVLKSSSTKKQIKENPSNRWSRTDSNSDIQPVSCLAQTSPEPPLPLIDLPKTTASNHRKTTRVWKSVEEARQILGLDPARTECLNPLPAAPPAVPVEMPPFSFSGANQLANRSFSALGQPSGVRPESLDVAFTCYSKISAVGITTPQFDVAVTDFRKRNTPISDLFLTLRNRLDPTLPLYVAKEDVGHISGFAAVLADVPTVFYQGVFDAKNGFTGC